MEQFAALFEALVTTMQGGTEILMQYSLGILGFAVTIYVLWGWLIRMPGAHRLPVEDILGDLVLTAIVIGFYQWLMKNWNDLMAAVLDAVLFWAKAPAGETGVGIVKGPAMLWELGQRLVAPLTAFDAWQKGVATVIDVVTSPLIFIVWVVILGSFFWLTLNYGMALVEWTFAVLVGAVFF